MDTQDVSKAIDLARQHQAERRWGQAEAVLTGILRKHPENYDALLMLGSLALRGGRNDVAAGLLAHAVAVNPSAPGAHGYLGTALHTMGRLDAALTELDKAIALSPRWALPYYARGNCSRDMGKPADAIAAYRTAVALYPAYPEALNNLGLLLAAQDNCDEAAQLFEAARRVWPDAIDITANLAGALIRQGKFQEGLQRLQDLAVRWPGQPVVHNNLGNALMKLNRVSEAVAAYERAIALDANYAEARWNLARAFLLAGDFKQGWPLFEWRWQVFPQLQRPLAEPHWDGQPLQGRRIRVYSEPGFGATLQFARYLSLVAERGGQVVVECQPQLLPLIARMEGVSEVHATDTDFARCDLRVPLLTLALLYGTNEETIPRQIPYVSADPQAAQTWRKRLELDDTPLKIGLAWTPRQSGNTGRACPLKEFAPLAHLNGVRLYSLQKRDAAQRAADAGAGVPLVDFTDELADFGDTAALIENLDLVISVDTAVAHLAGAMGKTVWTLLPFAPDWRWMLERRDSPWYPTMRLFRQATVGNWGGVIEQVCAELQKRAQLAVWAAM